MRRHETHLESSDEHCQLFLDLRPHGEKRYCIQNCILCLRDDVEIGSVSVRRALVPKLCVDQAMVEVSR